MIIKKMELVTDDREALSIDLTILMQCPFMFSLFQSRDHQEDGVSDGRSRGSIHRFDAVQRRNQESQFLRQRRHSIQVRMLHGELCCRLTMVENSQEYRLKYWATRPSVRSHRSLARSLARSLTHSLVRGEVID